MIFRSSYLLLITITLHIHTVFRTNVLQPYNIFLQPDPYRETLFSFQLGYEGICATKAFAPHGSHSSALQLFQRSQDALAAFKGFPPESPEGQYAQIFNTDDDNGSEGHYIPKAHLSIPLNGMLSIQGRLAHNVSLHGYIPFIYASLSDVRWTPDKQPLPEMLAAISELGCLDVTHGWKRLGFGDLVMFVKWQQDFWQNKPLLRDVRLSVRAGLNLPTGKKEDINKLLALPFGYDRGVGIYFGGFMTLIMNRDWRFMIDLEFLQLLGNKRERRIKTDPAQTDLLLIARDRVFVDPGFTQQYTFMLERRSIVHGLGAGILYQYFKHNDDTYYPLTNFGNYPVINDAESVQEYTTHQFIFTLKYEFHQERTAGFRPNLMLFGKYGFNGKRAILTSSIGLQFTCAF